VTPEELLGYYPDLALAGIYDALAYYYDNREALDREIADHAEPVPQAPVQR
jgi:uncharacterized protein (DUF433 family)